VVLVRQLIVEAPGSPAWAEVPEPELTSEHAALVRPIAVATCDFDHLIVAGLVPIGMPTPIGHECVAEVTAVGAAVESVSVGERVVVPFQISCGTCASCRRGRTSCCEAVPWLSCYGLGELSGSWGGAAADLVAVPYADAMLVPLPAGVDPVEAASVGCNLVDAYRCVGPQLLAAPGADVLVMSGAFANIALYATAIAVAFGSEVTFVDPSGASSAAAGRIGARVVDDPGEVAPLAYPVTVDASMDPALLQAALHATAPGGECTVSTMYVESLTPVPLMALFERCATLRTGQPHARALVPAVLELLASGRLPAGLVTEAVLPWSDAPEAFGSGTGKVVLSRAPERAALASGVGQQTGTRPERARSVDHA
jgi:alcohol dehydrogenase